MSGGAGRSYVFCKQKTAYEIRPRDWSSDVCSSDLLDRRDDAEGLRLVEQQLHGASPIGAEIHRIVVDVEIDVLVHHALVPLLRVRAHVRQAGAAVGSEERRV